MQAGHPHPPCIVLLVLLSILIQDTLKIHTSAIWALQTNSQARGYQIMQIDLATNLKHNSSFPIQVTSCIAARLTQQQNISAGCSLSSIPLHFCHPPLAWHKFTRPCGKASHRAKPTERWTFKNQSTWSSSTWLLEQTRTQVGTHSWRQGRLPHLHPSIQA